MSLSLINPAILYGLGLAAIPVLLHFLLRSKPKKLLFPALQLIVVRRKNNVRRMRLRHLWLLLLRILVIALIVLAITRPSLPAASYGLNRREIVTLLAVVAASAAAYFGVLHVWRRKRLANHELAYRRTLLRGGTSAAALVLLVLLVAWPYKNRVLGELTAPRPAVTKDIPAAAVLVFDTSLSMGYRQENKTRLDVARATALEYLGNNLPAGSRVAVADTSSDEEILFQADLVAARARIDALEIHPVAVPLNLRVECAIQAQRDDREFGFSEQQSIPEQLRRDSFVREVYLFTDLSASGWKMTAADALAKTLGENEWVHVYVIDVGILEPTNFLVAPLRLSRRTVPLGGELFVTANVEAIGPGTTVATRTLELYVEDAAGNRAKKGQQPVQPGDSVKFPVRGLSAPMGRGEVRLVSSDPLEQDDVQYFTVAVRPPPRVLVVYEDYDEAIYWSAALGAGQRSLARYRVEQVHVSKLEPDDLSGHALVCLINVAAPSAPIWNALDRFVADGGGLFVVLGNPRVDPTAYNRDAAQRILPGEVLAKLPFDPPERLDLGRLDHPVLTKFDEVGGAAKLSSEEIKWYWRVKTHAGSSVIIPYTDLRHDPALLEFSHGAGRTLMFTTSLGRGEGDDGWADLAGSGWPYFILADQIAHYLSRQRTGALNYVAAETVSVPLDAENPLTRYLMQKPGTFQQLPGEVAEGQQYLAIDDADRLGNYTIVGADKSSSFTAGFSVNPDPRESDFTRLEERELNDMFGEGRYEVARNMEELTRKVGVGRIGQEMFPFVLACVMIFFVGEHVVANRFYRAEQEPEHR